MRTRLSGVLVLTLAAVLCTTSPAAASASIDAKWAPSPPIPAQGGQTSSVLRDVSVLSPTDVWTVGSWWDTDERPLAAHWNATGWTLGVMPKQEPHPSLDVYSLHGVDAVASADVWSVGRSWPQGTPSQTSALVLHYNGIAWQDVTIPATPVGTTRSLEDIDMLNATDGWGVGQSNIDGQRDQPFILRFQLGQWVQVQAPKTRFASQLTSVVAVSPADAWAVGVQIGATGLQTSLVLHFDGLTWTEVAVPGATGPMNESLNSVAATAGDIWAAGSTCDQSDQSRCAPLILRFSGGGWKRMPAAANVAKLSEVIAFAPADVWVVGESLSLLGSPVEHAEHWDGQVFTADPGVIVSPNGQLGSALALAGAAADPVSGVIYAVGWVDRTARQTNVVHRG